MVSILNEMFMNILYIYIYIYIYIWLYGYMKMFESMVTLDESKNSLDF